MLTQQLARLKAQSGGAERSSALREPIPAPMVQISSSSPSNWRELLGRLRPAAGAIKPAPGSHGSTVPSLALLGMQEVAPGIGLIESRRPVLLRASDADLASVLGADAKWSRLLAFDLETSGLGQAAGVRAFMIGYATIDGDSVLIRQWLLLKPGSEAELLRRALLSLTQNAQLLSYNGRAFDWPLLRERFRLVLRQSLEIPGLHADLLHLVRKRYRLKWPDCRLKTTEQQLLGLSRENDLPGSEAPAAWSSFLRTGQETNLARIAQHNADDLFSLHLIADQLAIDEPSRVAAATAASSPPSCVQSSAEQAMIGG